MKTLEDFKTEHLDKSELFNTMSKNIFGGSTDCNGQVTATKGNDHDTATSDEDQFPDLKGDFV